MADVFISYSSHDRGFVEQLVRDLITNGITTWYDRWEMVPGDSLTQKIGIAILNNHSLVVVLSPSSVNSEWVQRELGVALNREFRERSVKVIPALLEDCLVPPFLSDKVYADFRSDYGGGLRELIGAVSGGRSDSHVTSSLPASPPALLSWDNVVGSNLTTENLTGANIVDDQVS